MVKYIATDKQGKPVIGLGLSENNIQNLRKNMPIQIHGKDIDRPDIGIIVIFYGRTEEVMADMIKRSMNVTKEVNQKEVSHQ